MRYVILREDRKIPIEVEEREGGAAEGAAHGVQSPRR